MKPFTTRVTALLFAVCTLFTFAVPAVAQPATQAVTIGVSIPTLDTPFWVRSVDFAEHVAKQLGVNSESFAKFRQQFIDNNPPYDVKAYSLTFNPQATQQTFPLRIKE